MMAAGVARPIAQGQAMIRTAGRDDERGRQRPFGQMRGPEEAAPASRGLPGPIRRQAPPEAGSQRHGDHERHKDAADPVTQSLDVRPAGLGALDGGDDVRQGRLFARRSHAHHQPAVEVHRPGVKPGCRSPCPPARIRRSAWIRPPPIALRPLRHRSAHGRRDAAPRCPQPAVRPPALRVSAPSGSRRRARAGARFSSLRKALDARALDTGLHPMARR